VAVLIVPVATGRRHPAFLLASAALLLLAATPFRRPRAPRPMLAAAAAALLLEVVAAVHLHLQAHRAASDAEAAAASRLRQVEERARSITASLQDAADRAAALPEVPLALAGDRAALIAVFRSLEDLRGTVEGRPALALHASPLTTVAWSGRLGDPAIFEGLVGGTRDVFILGGSVSTTLVAVAPVASGTPRPGFISASLPVAVRRNIRNEFLSDVDLLAGQEPGIEVRYVDARDEQEGPRPFPPPPSGAVYLDGILRAPDGGILAAVRAYATDPQQGASRLAGAYRRGLSALAVLTLLAWAAGRPEGSRSWGRALLAAAGVRAVLLALGPPLPGPSSPLLSPDIYASTLLGPLLGSPLDLLFTTGLLLVAGLAVLAWALRRTPPARALWRLILLTLLAVAVAAATFAGVADTVANCSLDLEAMTLFPGRVTHIALQLSLALWLATGLLVCSALFLLAGPLPSSRLHRTGYAALVAAGAAAALTHPAAPSWTTVIAPALLLASAQGLALARPRWEPAGRQATTGTRAVLAVGGLAGLGLILYPALLQASQRSLRLQIERNHAPLVLRQPEWRAYVLSSVQEQLDPLNLLEDAPPGIYRPGIEDLAFAIWSTTDLAAFGVSSAVEIQDPSGAVISRFALNLPSLAGPARALPRGEAWQVSRESLRVASTEQRVLHAQRLLRYHGEAHGGIHVFVGEDFWNLPFVRGRDPYSVLYRTAARGEHADRPLSLLAYGRRGDVLFSSAERPPSLNPALARRASASPGGFWTVLSVDGLSQNAYVFASPEAVYALGFPRISGARYVGNLVEAGTTLALLGLGTLLVVVLVRSALGRRTLSLASMSESVGQRFALRLFVAFTVLAVVPAVVLQWAVSGFLASRLRKAADDQALERAAVAKKAVEDYAFFQKEETPGSQPVTDAALVWLASMLKGDLDVFEGGRLLATSKRELYTSGLLAPRVSGAVYRELVLEGQQASLRPERIGGFSYQVASVPVQLGGPAPGVLALPLALRQREVEATVADLDRTIRLASVVFFCLGAALAHSLARRISGPIRDLTEASRRIARGDLGARVEVASRDELQRLVEAFNQMAGDLERQRQDLERSNRLAAWADMARQVAHEVKNPLTPIQLSAEHLRRVYRDQGVDFPATLEACTSTILKQVRNLRGIVTEFSAFARPPAGELALEDPADVVAEAVRPYQAGLPPGVELTVELNGRTSRVRADRRLLERAVVNLVENALQAVGDHGRITVTVRDRMEDGQVEVEVLDSGPGVPEEARSRIFEPFFSTKTSGSGLGLALVKKIAEDHGGGVRLASSPGQPTRAALWLPAVAAEEG
jgi:signal transduction histidine kinase